MESAELFELCRRIETFVGRFRPELYSGSDAARLVDVFAKIEHLGAAGKVLAAARTVKANGWQASGEASAEDWLARATGASRSAAATTLDTGHRLRHLPDTEQALRAGELSETQASAVTSAGSADPTAERKLLLDARQQSVAALRKTAHAVRQNARRDNLVDRNAIHRTRYLRHWTADDGAFEGRFRLTPDHGAIVLAALRPHREAAFNQARSDGRSETTDAYDADALVDMARASSAAASRPPDPEAADSGGSADPGGTDPGGTDSGGTDTSGRGLNPTATINVRVDRSALLRGHTVPGETCEIEGIGPVPVETVRAASTDAVLKAILVDGPRIVDVRHVGRLIPTKLRIALQQRDAMCAVPGCEATHHLEIHHLRPFGLGGETSLDNLARVCSRHHDQITYQGAALTGHHPHWHWHPPGSPGHTERTNPDPPGEPTRPSSPKPVVPAAPAPRTAVAVPTLFPGGPP